MEPLQLQIRREGAWLDIARIFLLGKEEDGEAAATRIEYDLDYALETDELRVDASLSLLHPVSLKPTVLPTWPSSLLDLMPQGHAMKFVEKFYKIPDLRKNYWKILGSCLLYPPGNLRIVSTGPTPFPKPASGRSQGFTQDEVTAKGEEFLEHMLSSGAPVAGTTGANGAAPKFLLREDLSGRFHADAALDDKETRKLWFVKFPRGKTQTDRDILEAEVAIHEAAKECSLHSEGECHWRDNTLFLERFDRKRGTDGSIEFLGLESLYSTVGSVIFGEFRFHEEYIAAICSHSTSPETDIAEYLAREILSQMVANTEWFQSVVDTIEKAGIDQKQIVDLLTEKCTRLRNLWGNLKERRVDTYFMQHGINSTTMASVVERALKAMEVNRG